MDPARVAPTEPSSETLAEPLVSRPIVPWMAWGVLLLSLVLTAMVGLLVRRHVDQDHQRRLTLVTDQLAVRLHDRLTAQTHLLRNGALLWAGMPQPTPELWRDFVGNLYDQAAFPDLLGVGFAQAAHPNHSPLVYLEPPDLRAPQVMGFDLQSEPALRESLMRARDNGQDVMSDEIRPASGLPWAVSPVVALVVPVYATSAAPTAAAQRRADLRGWFFVPLRMGDLLAMVLRDVRPEVDLPLQAQLQAANLPGTATAEAETALARDSLRQQRLITFNGRPWLLTVDSPPLPAGRKDMAVWVALAVGTGLSLLLFALTLSVIRTRVRATQMARRFTQKLRRADQALRLSEARLRSTLDTLPYRLVELDLQGRYLDIRGPRIKALGLPTEVRDGMSVMDVTPPNVARTVLNALHKAMAEGAAHGDQYSIDLPGGERWFELSVTRKPMADGEEPRFIVLVRDVTEHRANQISLQTSLAFQQTMLDASSHAIIATTVQGTVTHFNRSAETMLGRSAAAMIGQQTLVQLFDPAELRRRAQVAELPLPGGAEPGFQTLISLMQGGEAGPASGPPQEWQMRGHDGTRFPALAPVVALRAEEGSSVTGYLIVIIDVSERNRIRLALQSARETADRANRAKSRFLAAASHDLRQPLAALSLYLGLLRSQLPAANQPLMRHVDDCVSSLTELLDDLLDVSKLDAGVVVPERSDFAADTLLRRQLSVHAATASLKGLRLRLRQSRFIGHTDPVLFGRIVGNLVANAIRYTERGGVLLGCRRVGGRWWVEVHDSGIGIAQDQLGVIFQEFRQLDSHGSGSRGSGLGLSIVSKTASLLGLQIRVRSTPGRGSMFAVELPAGRHLERDVPAPAASAPALPQRVAVVDDNPNILRALSLLLQQAGHEVVAAADLTQLMAGLGGVAPSLVITDYRLAAGRTGFEVIDAIRHRFDWQVPALMITGETDPEVMRSMAEHGIEIQYKPLNPADLLAFAAQLPARHAP